MSWVQDHNRIEVYSESRKRRQFVGTLSREPATGRFRFEYDRDYLRSKRAISLGPELNLSRPLYESEPGSLFPSFADRIPSRNNPAYAEYCAAAGISPDETDPMVILPAIARRGPSTFIFEAVWKETIRFSEELKQFRQETGLSFYDVAQIVDVPILTIKRLEGRLTRRDAALTGFLRVLLDHPAIFLEWIKIRGSRLHDDTRRRLESFLQKRLDLAPPQAGES